MHLPYSVLHQIKLLHETKLGVGHCSPCHLQTFATRPRFQRELCWAFKFQMDSNVEDTNTDTKSSATMAQPYKDPDDGRQRFLLEAEFVQCLANPAYIHYLAQNRYFEDESFIGYLKYLQYWQRPEYIKFIMFPHCLFFLELLQNANFRNAMAHPASKELAHRQQYFFWKNYRNNRLKHIVPRPLPEPVAPPPTSPLQPMPPSTAASTPSLPIPPTQIVQPGSIPPKVDIRSSTTDRRKRKKEG